MHLRIKICGITSAADGRQAALLGADAVGLNFYPGSRRYISPEAAREILNTLPASIEAVGLFVEQPLEDVVEQARRLGIATVQWHGRPLRSRPWPPSASSPLSPCRTGTACCG